MSAPKPEHWASTHDELEAQPFSLPEDITRPSLPTIPDAASQALVASVVSVQTAQHNLASTVHIVLATLGLSVEEYDISLMDGRAVVVERPA